jgi:hypothetical protein
MPALFVLEWRTVQLLSLPSSRYIMGGRYTANSTTHDIPSWVYHDGISWVYHGYIMGISWVYHDGISWVYHDGISWVVSPETYQLIWMPAFTLDIYSC